MKILIGFLLALFISGQAIADDEVNNFINGCKELLKGEASADNLFFAGVCRGQIDALRNEQSILCHISKSQGFETLLGADTDEYSFEAITRQVINFMESNPKLWELGINILASRAMTNAFPCE